MKVYIAGPMTGLPEKNYPAFMEAERALTLAGFQTLNPARIDEMFADYDGERDWHWYMGKSIPMVEEADGLAVLPEWFASRGARIEVDLALEQEKFVASVPTWVAHRRMLQDWHRIDGGE